MCVKYTYRGRGIRIVVRFRTPSGRTAFMLLSLGGLMATVGVVLLVWVFLD